MIKITFTQTVFMKHEDYTKIVMNIIRHNRTVDIFYSILSLFFLVSLRI